MTGYRTGLMIIRAWIEDGSAKPLRARIRVTNDVATGEVSEMTLTDVDEVSVALRDWLRDLLATDPPQS